MTVEVEPSTDPLQSLRLLENPDRNLTRVIGEPQILPHYQGFQEHSPVDSTSTLLVSKSTVFKL